MTENNSAYWLDWYAKMYSHSAFGYGVLKGRGVWWLNIIRGVNNTPKRISWRGRPFGRIMKDNGDVE